MANQHPTESDLHKFANGELDDERFEEVAAHLEHCDECSDVLRKTGAFKSPVAASTKQHQAKANRGRQSTGVEHAPDQPAEIPPTEDIRSSKHGIAESTGSRVGPYKLLQELGHGGMGVVYMAEQERPVRRMVALKIIKPGMDSQQVIARFEAERQALAMMDHHNITKVLDAGTTDTGRPYFAMELVKGVPMTDYCDKNKLTPRERLEMFIPVCHAIQHAHQKGIIHRDIKPSNVLVTLYDGKPVPKVIDFGIAKATQQKLTERTMFTGIGQILGTLEYMSPEQAEMNQLDIDTRSDVYSLGVMLYELLTGSTPITKEKLRDVGFEEMLRTIRETEPPKPSTRLSDSAEALPSISAVRKTEPAKLSKLVRGDLDWIVMKALEKDRTRRYETANSFASDIQRFLCDEAVEACPPSASYRFRKFARRNKSALATSIAVAGILIVATILSSTLAIWANRAEKVASLREQEATKAATAERIAREDEQEQRGIAEENASKAIREATKSNEVATFLKDMLKGVGPSVALGRDTKMLREILDKTSERLEDELANQPEVEADIRAAIGEVYRELGEYDDAEAMQRRVLDLYKGLDTESPSTAVAMQQLARTFINQGELSEAEELLAAALKTQRSCLPDDHLDIAETLRLQSMVFLDDGRLAEAEIKSRQALDMSTKLLGEDHIDVAKSLNCLGRALFHQDRHVEAEHTWRKELAIVTSQLSELHPHAATTTHNVAIALSAQGNYTESTKFLRKVLAIDRKLYRGFHPSIAITLHSLSVQLKNQGHSDEAEPLMLEALEQKRQLGLDKTTGFAKLLRVLGDIYMSQGRYAEAEQPLRQVCSLRQHLGGTHPDVGWAVESLATTLCQLGRHSEAEAFLTDSANHGNVKSFEIAALSLVWNDATEEHIQLCSSFLKSTADANHNASSMRRVARSILLNPNVPDELVEQAAVFAEKSVNTERGVYSAASQVVLGIARYRQKRHIEAEKWLRKVWESPRSTRRHKVSDDQREMAISFLAMNAKQQGNRSQAKHFLELAEQRVGIKYYLIVDSPVQLGEEKLKSVLPLREAQSVINGQVDDVASLSDAERIERALSLEAAASKEWPDDSLQRRNLAWYYAWFGDEEKNTEFCRILLTYIEGHQFDDSYLKFVACERTLDGCLMTHAPSSETLERMHALAKRTLRLADTDGWRSWAEFLLALTEYRRGDNQAAETRIMGIHTDPTLLVERLFVLAMARHKLGKSEQARTDFERATDLLPNPPSRTTPTIEMYERSEHGIPIQLLYEEAKDVLGLNDGDEEVAPAKQ